MTRFFTTLFLAAILAIAAPLYAQQKISLPYIVSQGMPGDKETVNITQYVWESPEYVLDISVRGLRLTFLESDYLQLHNGFCMVALAELHFFDAEGNELKYNVDNIDCNSVERTEGSLEGLYDNNYTTYYHSVWKDALVDNDSEVYIDIDFKKEISAFSFSYRTRNQHIYPTSIAITATGIPYDSNAVAGSDKDGDGDEALYDDLDYTPVDVLNTECLFITLANGGVDAYPLELLSGECRMNGGTLVVPLNTGESVEYLPGTYTNYGTEAPELPYLTSYKFNNKYNANLNADVESDSISENLSFNVNAIGKNLTASFQLSNEQAVAYIGKKLQVSKESRNRFDTPVKYTVTYPGYNVLTNIKIQDEKWEYGEDVVTEIPLTEDMLYTNKPSEVGDHLRNMLDGNPSTVFHTVYGAAYDASVMPYITIALDAPVEAVKFYYMTRTTGNYSPMQLNLYASNDNNSWKLIRGFSSTDDGLPLEPAGAEYTSPSIELDGSYRYLKLEQTASEHRNNHMVFAEFRLYDVVPGSGEVIKVQDAAYKSARVPFGRIYTVNTNWLTDAQNVARIDIDIENGLSVTSKNYYLNANFRITGNGVYDDFVDSVQIKGRGNTTWGYSKKPYRLKFASKVKPFGLTKGKSWVLLANAQKGAMMVNAIAMKVGQLAEVPYTNHIIPVELYINGEYKGNYMFTEHIGFSNNSVDVDEDLGVGYMLELDSYYDEDYRFKSAYYNLPVNVKEPDLLDYDSLTAVARFAAIRNDFNELDSLVYNDGNLAAKLDLDVAARFMLVNDLVLNMELNHPKSTYLWREDITSEDSKIMLGPLWDFDWAFGYEGSSQYFYRDCKTKLFSSSTNPGCRFFKQLMANKEFQRYYYNAWNEFNDKNHIKEVVDFIDDYYQFIRISLEHNATIWGDGTTYGQKIEVMQSWMQGRFEHLFANLTKYDIIDLIYTLLGDVDCNDMLTVHDIIVTADYIQGDVDSTFNIVKADVDEDGQITFGDVDNIASQVAAADPVSSIYYYNTPVAQSLLSMDAFEASLEEGVTVPLLMTDLTDSGYKAFQADVTLPVGVLLTDVVAGERLEQHNLLLNQLGEQNYRVVAFADEGNVDSGELLASLSFYVSELVPEDERSVTLSNILVVCEDGNTEQRLGNLDVSFDISTGMSAVEAAVSVRGGEDIVITLLSAKSVDIFSVDGRKVRSVEAPAGTTRISLPAGVYVVEGKKVLVH